MSDRSYAERLEGIAEERVPQFKGRASLAWLCYLSIAAMLVLGATSLARPLTTYKVLNLGGDGFTVGGIGALYALLPLICISYLGTQAQQTSSLASLLITGSTTVAVGCATIALGHKISLIALGTVVMGMGQLVFVIAGQATIARFAGKHQFDMAFGWFTAGFSAGQMLGPIIGGTVIQTSSENATGEGLNLALWISSISAGLVLLLLLFTAREFRTCIYSQGEEITKSRENTSPTATEWEAEAFELNYKNPSFLRILQIPHMKSHILASIALLAMVDMLMTFLPLVGEEAGISPLWVGILLSVRAAASISSRMLLPLLRRAASRNLLVLLALWISGGTLALLPFVMQDIPLSIGLMSFAGFFLGIGQPLTMSLIANSVQSNWRSPALAARMMGNRIGQVTIPLAAGALTGVWGPATAIWLACALLIYSGTEQLIFQKNR